MKTLPLDYIVYHRLIASKRKFSIAQNGQKEAVVFVKPDKAFEPGIQHFSSYKKKSFSTFFTGIGLWDTESEYYKQGRKAAKKLKEFIRVFIVHKLSDLRKPTLIEQIKLDLQAGIKTYLCLYQDVKDKIP